jgi:hypothetical protein
MEVNITDDKRRQVAVAVKDTGVGTYHAEYTAEKPGMIFIRSDSCKPVYLFLQYIKNILAVFFKRSF